MKKESIMDDLTVSLPPSLVQPTNLKLHLSKREGTPRRPPIAFENSTHSEGDHQEMASGGQRRRVGLIFSSTDCKCTSSPRRGFCLWPSNHKGHISKLLGLCRVALLDHTNHELNEWSVRAALALSSLSIKI